MEERQTFERLIVIATQAFRDWSGMDSTRPGIIYEEARSSLFSHDVPLLKRPLEFSSPIHSRSSYIHCVLTSPSCST